MIKMIMMIKIMMMNIMIDNGDRYKGGDAKYDDVDHWRAERASS